MSEIEGPRVKLGASVQTATSLTSSVQQAAYSANGVSSRINAALGLYNRARDARTYLDDTITLKTCLLAMQDAIDTKNWERAAAAAKKALDLPESLKTSEFALRMVPSTELPDEPTVTLKAGCDGMATFFLKQFDIACAARDTAAITRWFRLLPQINHHKDGLQRYSRFIAGIVAGQSRDLLKDASSDNPSLYGIAMSRLFESIAAILDQHSKLVETYYGDAMPQVIDVIQNEVDVQGGLIIDTWLDERKIDNTLADIKAYQYPGLITLLGVPTEGYCDIDFEDITSRLSELHLMLNRWQLYNDFLQRWPASSKTMAESALGAKFKETLQPCFDKMAIFVFRRTVERAFEEEQMPSAPTDGTPFSIDQPLVTSTVDDVTMALNSLIDQALSTSISDVEQTVLISLSRVLRQDYAKIISRKITTARTKHPIYVYLNDLEVSAGYVERIVERAKDQYPDENSKGLDQIVDRYKETVQDISAEVVRSQYTSAWATQVRTLCGQVFKGTYLMSPTEPESTRGQEFEAGWNKMVAPLRESLHPNIYNRYMVFIAQSIARLLEKWIFSLENKVNELGAIALDRDISRIITIASRSKYSIRDNFAKVAAMVDLIETGSGGEDTLTESEIEQLRKVLV